MGRRRGFNELVAFNDVVKIPLAGLAVHRDAINERPDEIVKVIKAVLKSMQFIRSDRGAVLAHMETRWGIKDAEIREAVYNDVVELYSRTGIVSDDKMQNAIRMVQEARKIEGSGDLSGIVDWSFAKRANEELKGR
jgi:ABC-type nitrate/sulfonate/bicarbonate transport system substrate-binding protein